jgi:glycosyltransferase involved in cell wall biosynthesis
VVIQGSGEAGLERQCREAAQAFPGRVSTRIGYDEDFAHAIEAGSDVFVVPSRFEPCGLPQMYALRYGTLPVVRRPGGLADSVVDMDESPGPASSSTRYACRCFPPFGGAYRFARRGVDAARTRHEQGFSCAQPPRVSRSLESSRRTSSPCVDPLKTDLYRRTAVQV